MKTISTNILLGFALLSSPVSAGNITVENKSSFNIDLKITPTGGNRPYPKGLNKRFLKQGEETSFQISSREKSEGTENIQITFTEGNEDRTFLLSGTKTGAGITSPHSYNFAMCSGMDPDKSYKVTIKNSLLGKVNGLRCTKKEM